jgi:putative membrane protein
MRMAFTSLAAACAAAVLSACGQGEPQGRTVIDTAGGAVIDSSPNVATSVAAILSDENVIAVIDTSLGAALEMDTLAQRKATDAQLKALITREIPEHNLMRRASKDVADRLRISPVLPDRDPIEGHQQAMRELSARTGADFDRAYLDRSIKMREELLDEVQDGLKGRQTKAVRTFLEQVRANVESDLRDLRGMRNRLK